MLFMIFSFICLFNYIYGMLLIYIDSGFIVFKITSEFSSVYIAYDQASPAV